MKLLTVKQVADHTGVSVKTLHHYDKIKILVPKRKVDSGYRMYGEVELLRLQQILFYKELGFRLKEIKEILDDPRFNILESLEKQKYELRNNLARISKLINTIDHTIDKLKNDNVMKNPKELYEGFAPELGTTLRDEAIEKYGKEAITDVEKHLMSLGKKDFKLLQQDFKELNDELFRLKDEDPKSYKVQIHIAKHYEMIRRFWGTLGNEDRQAKAYAGLGQLYVEDQRYTQINGNPQPEFAQFLKVAMKEFAEKQLK